MVLMTDRLNRHSFDQLVEEGFQLLIENAPGWTDHNLHDPGVTLMELFAWLVEMDLYRLSRIPPATQRAFLRLLGIELCPPQVAETVLVFEPAAGIAVEVPRGLQVSNKDGGIIFQTTKNLLVSPAKLQVVLSGPEAHLVARSGPDLEQRRQFDVFGDHPRPGSALYLGFDAPFSALPKPAQLYLWTGNAGRDRQTRDRLRAEWQAASDEMPESHSTRPALPNWREHYAAHTIWEFYGNDNGELGWHPLARVVDQTRSLTLSGMVRFAAPGADAQVKGAIGVQKYDNLYFIRCRLVSGGYDCTPRIENIALNAVPAQHAVDKGMELFRSNGQAEQIFKLQHAPVVPGSIRLTVTLNGQDEGEWHEAADWDQAVPYDQTFVVSPETGSITFGNGRIGYVPPAGAEISATYQSGGGVTGNLPAGQLVTTASEIQKAVRVRQPYAAEGGRAAEILIEGRARAIEWMAARHRAVTLQDFAMLARETPGVPVGRSYAIPHYYPRLPGIPAPGSITVVIIPDAPGSRPMPSAAMCQVVLCYLERRRTVATELHVVGPAYTTVAVHARLHPKKGADSSGMAEKARTRLNDFFHPLHGGPRGEGWPVGREVVEAEMMALLNALPGVDYVDEVSLWVESIFDPAGGRLSLWHEANTKGEYMGFKVRLLVKPATDEEALVNPIKTKLDQTARRLKAIPSGRTRQTNWEAERRGVVAMLRALPGVLQVEELRLLTEREQEQRCGVLSICPHGLIAPGQHQISIGGR